MIRSVLLSILIMLFSHSVEAKSDLLSYLDLRGGYSVVARDGYSLIVETEFSEVDSDLGVFKRKYLGGDESDVVVEKFLKSLLPSEDIVPFKPTLASVLVANVSVDDSNILMLDSSLDVGYFRAKGGVLEGGIVTFHGFTREVLGARFHKVYHIIFDASYIEARLQNIPLETLDSYFLK